MKSASLFTTYKRVYTDSRGSLVDMTNKDQLPQPELPPNINIYSFTINPGVSRGHHYHKIKEEWFFCAHGDVIVCLQDIKDSSLYSIRLSAFDGNLIHIPPNLAHCIFNKSQTEPAVIVSYSSKCHDPGNPDTYPVDLSHMW